jgi:hypothetical protein
MASKNVARSRTDSKSPRGASEFSSSKLLNDCGRCGDPIFMCRVSHGQKAVEVLEAATGDVALQTQLGTDELTAVEITSPRTFYRWHVCRGAFSRAPGAGKVRP